MGHRKWQSALGNKPDPGHPTYGLVLYAPNCLDFWLQAKTVQKNWLKLLSCLQILNLVWTTLWNHLNSLPNGHSGVRMVLDLFWTSKSGKCSQKSPKQNSPLILLQNFGTPIIFWKTQFFATFLTTLGLKNCNFFRNYLFCSKKQLSIIISRSGWIWSMIFSDTQKWSEFWHFEKLSILDLVCTRMEMFGFEVYHEYVIEYVEHTIKPSCRFTNTARR